MRKINMIVIHCTATRVTREFPVESQEACHKARGFRTIGYHYDITKNGVIYPCRPEEMPGAHAKHYNAHSIGICYEGCLDANGNPEAEILGHRDLPWVKKSCPCFDVKNWLKSINFHI